MDLDDIVGAAGDALPEGIGAGQRTVGGSGDDSITGTEGSDEIFADPVPVDDQGGDDEVWGLGGDDLVRAFGGDNRVHGGPGDDRLYTADGDDLVWGGTGSDELQGGRGVDLMWGGSADDEVRGGEDNDVLHGGLGDDRVIGGSGDDLLMGELGADALEGREGVDTFRWTGADEGVDQVLDFELGLDRLALGDMMAVAIAGAEDVARHVSLAPVEPGGPAILRVDRDGAGAAPWQELAVLQGTPGLDVAALYVVGDLVLEGQPAPPPFSALDYIATHPDLIDALGAVPAAGKRHYLEYGHAEGRAIDGFDEVQYLANYEDLQQAFGTDYAAATRHYIAYGYHEGRSPLAPATTDFLV